MNWIVLAIGGVAAIALSGMAWVRLAPQDPARWHHMPDRVVSEDLTGGAMRVIAGDAATLARLDGIIRATPRTTLLAGSVQSGRLSYVTRSLVFGFPDYTTIESRGGEIALYGRLRFGVSDMGVNAARLDDWLETLRQGG